MSVKSNVINHTGVITLSRPDKCNALTPAMLDELTNIFQAWEKDDRVHWILIEGEGKDFCAGGDVVGIYQAHQEQGEVPLPHLGKGYNLDMLVDGYPKVVVVHYKGVSMGGGVGLGASCDLRIADETTKWAMPETRLGMIPDCGMGHYLSLLPQPMGLYLSLSGAVIAGADIKRMGFATDYISSTAYASVRQALLNAQSCGIKVKDKMLLEQVLAPFAQALPPTALNELEPFIEQYFSGPNLPSILEALAAGEDEFAQRTSQDLAQCSPLALAITFEKYFFGKDWTRNQTYQRDLLYISYLWATGNVLEGIRNTMFEPNGMRHFEPATLADVDYTKVHAFVCPKA